MAEGKGHDGIKHASSYTSFVVFRRILVVNESWTERPRPLIQLPAGLCKNEK